MLLMAKDVSEGAQIEGSRGKHVYFLFLVGEGSDLMYQLIYSLGNWLYLNHRVRNKASKTKKNFSWAVSSVTYESYEP